MDKTARPTLTERRAEELRHTIALTARDLFIAEGNTTATVERICDLVGISPRTFHRHFPVKEDVLAPLFRQSEELIVEILRTAPAADDPAEVLARAFTIEVHRRDVPEFDRKFMDLMINTPPYRLRWLEWGEGLCGAITEYLAGHYHLGDDPFLRELPAQLAMQTMRQAYIHWVDTTHSGEFAEVEQLLLRGLRMLLAGLRPAR
ncbi:transcriptional regulator, TetR family [Nocardia farcinica]|uniref:Mycofactocin system transcriptional regulator n=2 Tax=Nocardia farcinica TaxID=37329 RepID=A0A0H5NH36_NOCFR|nr:TetR/AcrR family transcriptional regulator [Nocardia farcinica]AXK89237.1 TetR family transcriptional regulator [Nocardia farcinica]MBF6188966.1 TetR family transcriptional regulator [Nocardia farcinica]MBF6309441.1 TetR family transcriptional regulator [Nocardia farcinica]MBF6410721.1 TetR family transcriptional regulator [Nocardia farcinica]UEX20590.1 TetR/AcrR family transcriptional regulator [Nocardia farcinica]